MLCQIILFDYQQTSYIQKHRLKIHLSVQNETQHYCSRCCKLQNCVASLKIIEMVLENFHKCCWFSRGPNQEYESQNSNCNEILRNQFGQNNKRHFKNLTYLFKPYLLLLLHLFFGLFLMSCSNAAPLSKKQNNISSLLDLNWTNSALINQKIGLYKNISLGIFSNPNLQPPSSHVSLKIKRASEVNKRNKKTNQKNGKNRRRKQNKSKKATKRNRRKKLSKINATSSNTRMYTPEIIRHGHFQNSFEHGASPRRQRLYNKNGISYHLAVWRNGSVSGERSNKRSPYSKY